MLLALEEVVELLRYAGHQREEEHTDRQAIERLTRREQEVLQVLARASKARQSRTGFTSRCVPSATTSPTSSRSFDVHSQLQAVVFALRYDAVKVR
jgi:hypothetical protein